MCAFYFPSKGARYEASFEAFPEFEYNDLEVFYEAWQKMDKQDVGYIDIATLVTQ